MNSRWRWVAFGAVVLALAGAGTAWIMGAGRSSSHPQPSAAGTGRPRPLAPLAALPSRGSAPAPDGVVRSLATALADPAFGGRLAGEVVDGLTGQTLLDRQSTTARTPASTVKLLTAVAALESLGSDATLTTGVVRDGQTLYLLGGGDVTLLASTPAPGARGSAGATYPPAASLADLARQTASALGPAARVRLCLDTTLWTGPAQAPGWNPGYFSGGDIAPLSALEVDEGAARAAHPDHAPIPRVTDPAGQAGRAFTTALRAAGVQVAGPVCRAAAPSGGFGVASVASAPLAALVQRMLTRSDNDLAEALGRAVARRAGRPADFTGAAATVTDAIHRLGVDVTGLRLYDASGLSRLDRVSPRTLVQVVQLATGPGHPQLRAIADGLPVAGLSGTLAERYRRGPAASGAGVVRAKTGTLAGVNSVAGYLVDADGRLLVFAFLTDRATAPDATEAALDRLVARLTSCGCS